MRLILAVLIAAALGNPAFADDLKPTPEAWREAGRDCLTVAKVMTKHRWKRPLKKLFSITLQVLPIAEIENRCPFTVEDSVRFRLVVDGQALDQAELDLKIHPGERLRVGGYFYFLSATAKSFPTLHRYGAFWVEVGVFAPSLDAWSFARLVNEPVEAPQP